MQSSFERVLAEVTRLQDGINLLHLDLANARANGTILTYGYIQQRLRDIIVAPKEEN